MEPIDRARATQSWKGDDVNCRLCARFWDEFWERSDAWEREHSNENELLSEESDRNWELIQQASAIDESDPAASFQLYLKAAEDGSAWAMEAVGWRYWTGTGVPADSDRAQNFYRRAIARGSLMAAIYCARLLAETQLHDECEQALQEGVGLRFTPAYFWLARSRYDRFRTHQVAQEIRPLLEYAAREGHPGAASMLTRLMVTGKFGLRAIPKGLIFGVRAALNYADTRQRDARTRVAASNLASAAQ